ncbi:MAG: fumarylacetoacetate hydrolase family protein [Pseudomonadota bacterium]|nr:fumarylacetoacetate hydrolase family protein [Pseudomonadota bacterium]
MKFVSFYHDGDEGFGAIKDDYIIDLSKGLLSGETFANLKALLKGGGSSKESLKETVENGSNIIETKEVNFRMPICNPGKIFCVGRNYYAYHEVMEDGRPDWPSIFPRFNDSFAAHEQAIIRGTDDADQLDYEGELVVVIGKQGRHISEKAAMSYVGGYTIANEGSVRNWIGRGTQNCPVKNQWRSGSMGPWIVTPDEILNPMNLKIITRVNGEERQNGNTDMMIFDIPFVISYISRFTMLEPGDLICTGSPGGSAIEHDPPAYLKPGDNLEVQINGVGLLKNPVQLETLD